MCLAVPARIMEIRGTDADVEVGGVGRTISLMLTPEARVGDYVYVHTGFAIGVLDEAEALESLRLLASLAETYSAEELYLTSSSRPLQTSEVTDKP
jgi:hydrogenase expression/formation protein HypC